MSKSAGSLIEAAAEAEASAPAFSFFDTVEGIEDAAAAGLHREFTGERLHRDRPETYQAIVTAYANGLSIRQIARALRVSTNTVAAVIEREPKAVETHKQRTISGLRRFVGATIERMLEDLDRMPLQSLPVALGVAVDKLQLLSGEVTSRVERVQIRTDQVQAFVASLPVIEAELVEDEISTGIAGQIPGQKGTDAPAAAPLLPAPSSDIGSDDEGVDHSVDMPTRATPRATQGDDTPPSRGGGGHASEYPQPLGIDPEKQNFGQRANVRESGLGGRTADKPLCKRTPPKKKGSSKKAPTTAKKKGGSEC